MNDNTSKKILYIKTLTGKDVLFNFDDNTTVNNIMSDYWRKNSIKAKPYKIIFNGKQLNWNDVLSEVGVPNEGQLHLVEKLEPSPNNFSNIKNINKNNEQKNSFIYNREETTITVKELKDILDNLRKAAVSRDLGNQSDNVQIGFMNVTNKNNGTLKYYSKNEQQQLSSYVLIPIIAPLTQASTDIATLYKLISSSNMREKYPGLAEGLNKISIIAHQNNLAENAEYNVQLKENVLNKSGHKPSKLYSYNKTRIGMITLLSLLGLTGIVYGSCNWDSNKAMTILSGIFLCFTIIGTMFAFKKGYLTNNDTIENQNYTQNNAMY